ncbi:metallophosphoesterase [Actinoplanes sp. ATCC 53533]|uniref:metallophosphoesterase n=1 Tax=Actinoplanes sp. ATCC 53533 TaxID=1288362 RepID=UPI0018F66A30|nr:metallophosphoesterase [Actinoplanes sp. ATCC 53533]
MAFFGLIFVVIGLIHFYLWKRLVRDPFRPGGLRRAGALVAVLLAVLVPTTLIGVRSGYLEWLAWPGYLWLALMFYLFVTLVVLEIPRLAISLWIRATSKSTARSKAPKPGKELGEKQGEEEADGPLAATAGTEQTRTTTAGARPGIASAAGTRLGTTSGAEGPTSATSTVADREDPGSPRGIDRRLLLARGAAIFAGLTAVGTTGYGVKSALGPPQLDRVQLPMAKLPRAMDGTRLAVVSDIHLGPLTGAQHAGRIVNLINSVNADIVCIVGDLVDGTVAELGRFAAPLADIESRRGAYFVTGNHEYYSGYQEWVAEVARLGVRPLRNERLEIGGLDLAGVNDIGGVEFGDGPDLRRALGDRDVGRPVVLMAHQPVVARDAAPFGVDLQVSGHTHGGQMVPFNLLVPLQQPVVSGFGEVDGVPVYVTNGAGFWGPPVRVGAPPQVTVIELRTP